MVNIIIIDKDKNSVEVNLWEDEYNLIFKDKIEIKDVKKHKTLTDLNKEVRDFIKENKDDRN